MLAYWHATHDLDTDATAPMLSSGPAGYHGEVRALLLQSRARRHKALPSRGAGVKVHGGEMTPQVRAMANAFRQSKIRKRIAKQTGSSPEAVDWLFDPER